MSASHHGPDDDMKQQLDAIIRRFIDQGDGNANRAYPDGLMGAHDEGELAFAVAVDEKHGTVVLNFNKPVAWMGMSPRDAVRLAELLIETARTISREPLAVNLN